MLTSHQLQSILSAISQLDIEHVAKGHKPAIKIIVGAYEGTVECQQCNKKCAVMRWAAVKWVGDDPLWTVFYNHPKDHGSDENGIPDLP